jgi:hypothetical protein
MGDSSSGSSGLERRFDRRRLLVIVENVDGQERNDTSGYYYDDDDDERVLLSSFVFFWRERDCHSANVHPSTKGDYSTDWDGRPSFATGVVQTIPLCFLVLAYL